MDMFSNLSVEPKQDQMLKWAKGRGIVSGVEVRTWGLNNYYITADRQMRKFAEKGVVKRLTETEIDDLKLRKDGQARVAFWAVV